MFPFSKERPVVRPVGNWLYWIMILPLEVTMPSRTTTTKAKARGTKERERESVSRQTSKPVGIAAPYGSTASAMVKQPIKAKRDQLATVERDLISARERWYHAKSRLAITSPLDEEYMEAVQEVLQATEAYLAMGKLLCRTVEKA